MQSIEAHDLSYMLTFRNGLSTIRGLLEGYKPIHAEEHPSWCTIELTSNIEVRPQLKLCAAYAVYAAIP